jgi:hypothetical protein
MLLSTARHLSKKVRRALHHASVCSLLRSLRGLRVLRALHPSAQLL